VTGTPTATPTPPYVRGLYLPQVLANWISDYRTSRVSPLQLPSHLPVILKRDT
jgi:hypothetical protein